MGGGLKEVAGGGDGGDKEDAQQGDVSQRRCKSSAGPQKLSDELRLLKV